MAFCVAIRVDDFDRTLFAHIGRAPDNFDLKFKSYDFNYGECWY